MSAVFSAIGAIFLFILITGVKEITDILRRIEKKIGEHDTLR